MLQDMRVSCEAIPEEISGLGTTPPSTEINLGQTQHPALLTCHSYPGPPQQLEHDKPTKDSKTVPVSPIVSTTTPPPLSVASSHNVFSQRVSPLKTSKSESIESMRSERIVERPTSLSSLANLPPLSSKPPQSPTQTSPRLPRHDLQSSSTSLNLDRAHQLKAKDGKKSGSNEKINIDSLHGAQRRDRGYTISVMSPICKPRLENLRHSGSPRPKEGLRSGVSPSFVFLQLYYTAQFGCTSEKPLLVNSNQVVQRAVKVSSIRLLVHRPPEEPSCAYKAVHTLEIRYYT